MPTLEQAFAWLIELPSAALYAAAFGFSALENIFPPFPADAFVALASFVANPGQASLLVVYLCVVIGNVIGAMVTFELGRRYGAEGLHRKMEARGLVRREEKMERLYERYGLVAIFLARMIPGVRAVVPPFAGAMRLRATSTMLTIGAASAIWYGVITIVAFRAGGDWRAYVGQVTRLGQWGAGVAAAVVVVIGVVAYVMLRRRKAAQ